MTVRVEEEMADSHKLIWFTLHPSTESKPKHPVTDSTKENVYGILDHDVDLVLNRSAPGL